MLPRPQLAKLGKLDSQNDEDRLLVGLLKTKMMDFMAQVKDVSKKASSYLLCGLNRFSASMPLLDTKRFRILSSTHSEDKYSLTIIRYLLFLRRMNFLPAGTTLNAGNFMDILESALLVEYSVDNDRCSIPAYQYLACSTLNDDGSYKNFNTSTQSVAHLIYVLKAVVMVKSYYGHSPSQLKFCLADSNNLFFELCQLMALLRKYYSGEVDKYNLQWGLHPDGTLDYTKIIHSNLSYNIEEFKTGFFKLCNENYIILKKLMFARSSLKLDDKFYSTIKEFPGSVEPGYSFYNSKANPQLRKEYYGYIDTLKNKFGNANESERITSKYRKLAQQYQNNLLVLYHISAGMPARATEISVYRLHNTQRDRRSIIWAYNTICFVQTYSKTNNLSDRGHTYIARYLPPIVKNLFMYYLLYVRSAQRYLKLIQNVDQRRNLQPYH